MTAEDRSSADALGRLLRDEIEQSMSTPPAWLQTGEQQLLRSLRSGSARSGSVRSGSAHSHQAAPAVGTSARTRAWLMAALLAAGVGIGASLVAYENATRAEGPALTFRMERAGSEKTAHRSGRIIAPADHAEDVTFSDGSRFTLSAGSMLRVRGTDAHGAVVIVEEGQVDSAVRHTGTARWSVFAGPYEVRVVGTRFSTAWDPARQRLSVVLHEGSVQVLGKGIDELVELKPGQRFESGGSEGKWFVTATVPSSSGPSGRGPSGDAESGDAESGDKAVPGAQPTGDGVPSGSGQTHASPAAAGTVRGSAGDLAAGKASWSTLVASGKFEEVLEEASIQGEAACLGSCSIADLRALADAARYTGRFVLAERALSRLRSTAPAEAPRAGFLLGSMNEAQGRASAALEWYGRYLEEAPGGGLVAEARAGRMRALLALGQTEAAKAAARDYLRLHPAGVGANTARQILHRP